MRFNRGEKIFSFLNPSRTERSMNKVASVFQSISESSATDGGVIKRDAMAAISATESITSFFNSLMNDEIIGVTI